MNYEIFYNDVYESWVLIVDGALKAFRKTVQEIITLLPEEYK